MDTGNDPGNDPGNDSGTGTGTGADIERMNDKELFELGITRTTVDIYHVGPYKYSKLKDALEEAMRNNTKKNNTDF